MSEDMQEMKPSDDKNSRKLTVRLVEYYKNNRVFRVGVHAALIVAVLVIGLAIGAFFNKSSNEDKTRIAGDVTQYAEDQDNSDIEESPSIAIPGYDTLSFKAGKKTQEVTLHNPKENTCYFKMSLILEDGTTIWTSDLLEPGKAFTKIKLDKSLAKGTYSNVKLRYACYSLKDQSQLNGAEIKVTIVAE